MPDPLTDAEIERLTAEVNHQLQALQAAGRMLRSRPSAEPQRQAIARATGQDADSFLARFRQAARHDLCEADGLLHQQLVKYRDLATRDMTKTIGGILLGMGLSGSALQIAVVAVLAYVLYLGVQAFCAGDG